MIDQLALFDFRTMAMLEDAGNHLDAGAKSGKERPVMGWPSLAIPTGVIVWYSLPGRNPYTAAMLERREAREHAAFVGDVMSEVSDMLREAHGGRKESMVVEIFPDGDGCQASPEGYRSDC